MKALSIRQPWASLIMLGHKTIETRSWLTNHRGTIMIHASKTVDEAAKKWLSEDFPEIMDSISEFPTGVLLGEIELNNCRKFSKHAEDDLAAMCGVPTNREYYSWVLDDPRPFKEPIPKRGMPGLFEV